MTLLSKGSKNKKSLSISILAWKIDLGIGRAHSKEVNLPEFGILFVNEFPFSLFFDTCFYMLLNMPNTPSYSNKHNVSLQYIVQFSKLLSNM
jgi:hypothetical protein